MEHNETHARVQNNLRWSHTFKLERKDMEHNSGVSMTVPNETYTIKELVERFSKGMDPSISRLAHGDEDPDIDSPDFREVLNMDFAEAQQYQEHLKARSAEIQQTLVKQNEPPKLEESPKKTGGKIDRSEARNEGEKPTV